MNELCYRSYLDSIWIKHKASEGTALYVISFMRYRNTPLSCFVGLEGRRMNPILLLDGTRQGSAGRRPRGHINTIMTSS